MTVSCIWVGINATLFQIWKTGFLIFFFLTKITGAVGIVPKQSHLIFCIKLLSKKKLAHQNGAVLNSNTRVSTSALVAKAHRLRLKNKTLIFTYSLSFFLPSVTTKVIIALVDFKAGKGRTAVTRPSTQAAESLHCSRPSDLQLRRGWSRYHGGHKAVTVEAWRWAPPLHPSVIHLGLK